MKVNYNGISGKLDFTSFRCRDCIFMTRTCHTLCGCFHYGVFIESKGDIFDENIL